MVVELCTPPMIVFGFYDGIAAFVLIACLISGKLLFGSNAWVLGHELPGAVAMVGYGFAIGLGSALMGIAGGSLVTMVLTLYDTPIHNAVAVSTPATLIITGVVRPRVIASRLSTAAHMPRRGDLVRSSVTDGPPRGRAASGPRRR